MDQRKNDPADSMVPVDTTSGAIVLPHVTLEPDGILHIDCSPCDNLGLEAVRQVNLQHRELCPGCQSPVLLTGGRIGNVEYKAQRFASSPEVCAMTAAIAIVTRSFLELHLARMFLMYHRPPYPARVFRNENEARNWLRSYLPTPARQ